MAEKSINNTGGNRLKRSLPADSNYNEEDALINWLTSQVQEGIHLPDDRSLSRPSAGGVPGPSPGTSFIPHNREEWIAICDEHEEEGRGLHGVLKSFDPSDPYGHETVHSTFSHANPAILEAVYAKRRRVGNCLGNFFEGLPAVPEGPQPTQPASALLRPRQTSEEPLSRQQQLALLPVDPRKIAGEPSGRAGSGSSGGEGQVKGKGNHGKDVGTGASALPVRSCLIRTHFREERGACVEVDPETLEEESNEN
ncbi:hypothetical protein FPCIR_11558 [Fusarium pseudocircinatum]|uniref:Uncharacterized protein n=1 Tax=Fusarium pseudocircinatum TaxID=56676 RepID=A0A8H5KRB1_9HYPO|nr:hypothetical protein FPCIR_11558 [Fusarium pseudocircinatum]